MNNLQTEPEYGGATRHQPPKNLITAEQAAKILRVSSSAVQHYRKTGKLPHAATQAGRGGDHYLYRKEDVEEFGKNNKIRHIKKRRTRAEMAVAKNGAAPAKSKGMSESARILRIVGWLNASGSYFEASPESVRKAAMRIGLEQLEKDAKK